MATYGWNPETGEQEVFDTPEAREVKGFLDYHPADEAKAPAKPKPEPRAKAPKHADDGVEKVKVLTRAEIETAFTEGGIEFDKSARVDVLDAQLNTTLRSVYTAKGWEMPADDFPTRTMLDRVRAGV